MLFLCFHKEKHDWTVMMNIDKTWEMFTDCGKYLRLWNKNGKLYLVFFCIDLMPHYLFQIIKCSQNTAKDSPFLFTLDSRQRQPTPVLLPGESHGRRSLVGCHLWGRTESDMTEAT